MAPTTASHIQFLNFQSENSDVNYMYHCNDLLYATFKPIRCCVIRNGMHTMKCIATYTRKVTGSPKQNL